LGAVTLIFDLYEKLRAFVTGFGMNLPDTTSEVVFFITLLIALVILAVKCIKLEYRIIPKIRILGINMRHEPKNILNPNTKVLRLYELKVFNDSPELLTNCQLKLVDMFNVKGERTRENGMPFKFKSDKPAAIEGPYIQARDIPPFCDDDFDLISFNETIPNNPYIHMMYARRDGQLPPGDGVPVQLCPHLMQVRVSADNSTPVNKYLRFNVDRNGFLEIKEVGRVTWEIFKFRRSAQAETA
ncbi:MAG TPA: hypothetical protein VGL10_10445, partial [Gammaproteobacteria bacterium]